MGRSKTKSRTDAIMLEVVRKAKAQNYPENKAESWNEHNFDAEKGFRYLANTTTIIRMYKPLPDSMTAAEIGMMLHCAQFIEMETGMLYYRSDRTSKPMSAAELAKRLGRSISQVYKFIGRMRNLRVMAKEDRRLYVNPCYFFRGRYLSYHLYQLFKPDLQTLLPAWVVNKYEGNA